MQIVKPEEWTKRALCRDTDPNVFFPTGTGGRRPKDAPLSAGSLDESEQAVVDTYCRFCDVREQCIDYAVRTGEKYGVWGSTSNERRVWISERKKKDRQNKAS